MTNLKRRILNLLIFILFSHDVYTQNNEWKLSSKEELMKQFEATRQWNRDYPCFSVDITHLSYEDYKSTIPTEKVEGFFHKCDNNYKSNILGIQTIQNEKYRVFIDSSKSLILIGNPTKENSYPTELYSESLLHECQSVKMQESRLGKKYYLQFEEAAYINSCEISINKDGSYKEIVLYFGKIVDKTEANFNAQIKRPRIKILFSNYVKNPVFNYNNEFSEANYFSYDVDKKLQPSNKYRDFKINDQRINKN